jgi:aminoglycoside phosphotransferase (APT) family kinase protein
MSRAAPFRLRRDVQPCHRIGTRRIDACHDRRMALPALDPSEIEDWLAQQHGSEICALEVLPSGYWSAAFGYEVDGRELVLRVGTQPDGFAMDRLAHGYARPGLPIPEVFDIGEAFGVAYAISSRFHGRFLESIDPGEAAVARPVVLGLLDALWSVPADAGAAVCWYGSDGQGSTWRGWLTDSLLDNPRLTVSGWRATIAADPALDRLYRACGERIEAMLPACPERRRLVHGDLLNRNVLIAEDATSVRAVFSWKCSVRGDGLYDVAWCTFWSPWHPGIAALDLWSAAQALPSAADDAQARHHCYLLHIGMRHLSFHAWTGNDRELWAVASRTADLLEGGPGGA